MCCVALCKLFVSETQFSLSQNGHVTHLVGLFINLFNPYLGAFCISGTVLGDWDSVTNKM